MVDGSLGHHGVVLKLRLAEGRSVGRDEDELGLAGAEGLESAAVAEDDLAGLDDKGELFAKTSPSAFWCFAILQISHTAIGLQRTLAPMLWASDLDFLGAIANDFVGELNRGNGQGLAGGEVSSRLSLASRRIQQKKDHHEYFRSPSHCGSGGRAHLICQPITCEQLGNWHKALTPHIFGPGAHLTRQIGVPASHPLRRWIGNRPPKSPPLDLKVRGFHFVVVALSTHEQPPTTSYVTSSKISQNGPPSCEMLPVLQEQGEQPSCPDFCDAKIAIERPIFSHCVGREAIDGDGCGWEEGRTWTWRNIKVDAHGQ